MDVAECFHLAEGQQIAAEWHGPDDAVADAGSPVGPVPGCTLPRVNSSVNTLCHNYLVSTLV